MTKDQAIALEDSQEAADAIHAVMAEYNFPCNPANVARVGWRAARLSMQPQAPDCRTCEHLSDSHRYCATSEHWMTGCTNGDKYQPAPAVVLWRTE